MCVPCRMPTIWLTRPCFSTRIRIIPYRSPVPGVQLLHCLANETRGGLSTLVDGFAAAQMLRSSDPEAFRVLSQTPVRFRFRDADTELVRSSSLIEVDGVGGLQAINFSPRLDYVPLLPPGELTAYFKARKRLDALLRSPKFEIRFLLNAGDLMMMDNRRSAAWADLLRSARRACATCRVVTSISMGRAASIACCAGRSPRRGAGHEPELSAFAGWKMGRRKTTTCWMSRNGSMPPACRDACFSRAQARSLPGGVSGEPSGTFTADRNPGAA